MQGGHGNDPMTAENEQNTPIHDLVLDFLTDYFYCTLTQYRLEDRCRQFVGNGDSTQLRPLLNETLRLCSEISARFPNLDAKANNLITRLQSLDDRNDGFMNDIAEAMGYCAEDRNQADDFSLCVLTKQIGQDRIPRQRIIVNPFEPEEPLEEEDPPAEEGEESPSEEEGEPQPEEEPDPEDDEVQEEGQDGP